MRKPCICQIGGSVDVRSAPGRSTRLFAAGGSARLRRVTGASDRPWRGELSPKQPGLSAQVHEPGRGVEETRAAWVFGGFGVVC